MSTNSGASAPAESIVRPTTLIESAHLNNALGVRLILASETFQQRLCFLCHTEARGRHVNPNTAIVNQSKVFQHPIRVPLHPLRSGSLALPQPFGRCNGPCSSRPSRTPYFNRFRLRPESLAVPML